MALQPIDLSTVYSQMDKVAKYNASQTQTAQIAHQMGQERLTQVELQKSQSVNEAAKNKADSAKIKDGDGGQQAYGGSSGKKQRQEEDQSSEEKKTVQITDPRLGQHIDITR